MDRSPAVAGFFYPADPDELLRTLEELFLEHEHGPKSKPVGDEKTVALLAPHAGYIYSGPCAAHAYTLVPKADTVVLVGPNHTGYGKLFSVRPDGKRITPIGSLEVDEEFVEAITRDGFLEKDYAAHINEHCLEVQLPFVIYAYESLGRDLPKIVPIIIARQTPDVAAELAKLILDKAAELGRRILLVASSDLDHYEPHTVAMAKDLSVIRCVEALDVKCFYNTMYDLNVSICGYGAIATAMYYTKALGGKARLLKHMTSGDVTGELGSVVGYASVQFHKRSGKTGIIIFQASSLSSSRIKIASGR